MLKNNRLYAICKEAVTLLFLFAMIISIMLWISRYYLEKDLADLMIANAVNIKSNEDANQRIIAINQKIKLVTGINSDFIPTRRIMEAVSLAVPETIELKSINFYRQQSTIEITGSAKTRNDLQQLKNILTGLPWIKNANLPMTDLIDKENNQFSIKLEVDLNKL